VGWGDSRSTHRLTLADGRVIAARRIVGPTAVADAWRVAAVMTSLIESDVPVPSPTVVEGRAADVAWLVTRWVEGQTGAAWLDHPDRARRLAGEMGRLASRLRSVGVAGLPLVATALGGHALATQARDQMAAVALEPSMRRVIETAIEPLTADGRAAVNGPPAFNHGDFAPVNVIVAGTGEVVALLDLEHSRLGPPESDVAWWGWVVRHHHPDAWAVGWRTICEAAGMADDSLSPVICARMLLSLLDRAATVADGKDRRRWLRRLAEAAAW
jgi:aminoglycoside phosphotransferase (APT) family kinase protein